MELNLDLRGRRVLIVGDAHDAPDGDDPHLAAA